MKDIQMTVCVSTKETVGSLGLQHYFVPQLQGEWFCSKHKVLPLGRSQSIMNWNFHGPLNVLSFKLISQIFLTVGENFLT